MMTRSSLCLYWLYLQTYVRKKICDLVQNSLRQCAALEKWSSGTVTLTPHPRPPRVSQSCFLLWALVKPLVGGGAGEREGEEEEGER